MKKVILLLLLVLLPGGIASGQGTITYELISNYHFDDISGWHISNNRQSIVVLQDEGPMRVWQLSERREICTFATASGAPFENAAWSYDDQLLAGVSREGLIVWKLSDCSVVFEYLDHDIGAMAFMPGANRLIFWCDDCGALQMLHVDIPSLVTLRVTDYSFDNPILLHFNPDGLMMSMIDNLSSFIMYHLDQRTVTPIAYESSLLLGPTFSPDTSYLAAGVTGGLLVIDTQSGDISTCPVDSNLVITQIDWLDDQQVLTLSRPHFYGHLFHSGSSVHHWSIPDCTELHRLNVETTVELPLTLEENERLIAYSDTWVQFINEETLEVTGQALEPTDEQTTYTVTNQELVYFDYNAAYDVVAVAGSADEILFWRLSDGTLLGTIAEPDIPYSVLWMDTDKLMVATDDGIRIMRISFAPE